MILAGGHLNGVLVKSPGSVYIEGIGAVEEMCVSCVCALQMGNSGDGCVWPIMYGGGVRSILLLPLVG